MCGCTHVGGSMQALSGRSIGEASPTGTESLTPFYRRLSDAEDIKIEKDAVGDTRGQGKQDSRWT